MGERDWLGLMRDVLEAERGTPPGRLNIVCCAGFTAAVVVLHLVGCLARFASVLVTHIPETGAAEGVVMLVLLACAWVACPIVVLRMSRKPATEDDLGIDEDDLAT